MGADPISIGLMVAGTLVSTVGGVMNAQAQAKEVKAKERMAQVQAQHERLQQIRQARIAQANIIQAGTNQGVGSSSSVTTGASTAYGQAEQNISYINNQENIGAAIFKAQRQQINDQGIQSIGKGISDIGSVFGSPQAKSVFG